MRWSPSTLSLVYADGLLTERFLADLGIADSCVLYGDYYHLFNEVWSKSETFGSKYFPLIKEYLKAILGSNTPEKWDIAYSFTKEFCSLVKGLNYLMKSIANLGIIQHIIPELLKGF